MNICVKSGFRGALIVLEGCDRSGKSTQCAKLEETLAADGRSVRVMKFPDRTTTIGQMIDSYLKQAEDLDDRTIHLLFSSNRWEAMRKMTDLLQAGTTLIVDRYAYSGIAYSAAKGLSMDWCRQPDVGLVKPDKVIYLSASNRKVAERAQFGSERYEKLDFQQRVQNIFLQLQDPSYWQTVNADAPIEEVHKEVYKIATETIKASERLPLLKLWTQSKDEIIPAN